MCIRDSFVVVGSGVGLNLHTRLLCAGTAMGLVRLPPLFVPLSSVSRANLFELLAARRHPDWLADLVGSSELAPAVAAELARYPAELLTELQHASPPRTTRICSEAEWAARQEWLVRQSQFALGICSDASSFPPIFPPPCGFVP